jgi:glycosyltransferase involved in cell wall biosynthesis
MQILWISHVIPYPPKAGFLLRAFHLLRGTAKHHTVDLIAFVQEPWLRTIYGDIEAGIRDSQLELNKFCRSVHFIPITSRQGSFAMPRTAVRALLTGRSYTTTWLDQANARQLITKTYQQHKHDLVHFDTIGLAPFRDCIDSTTAATLGHHNIESHLFTRRSQTETNALKRWYYAREGKTLRSYEQQMAARFSAHITCSELDNERLKDVAGNVPMHAVPNGVDCDYFAPMSSPQTKHSLVFVGTMNWHPNVDAMIFLLKEIWPELQRRIPDVSLEIVGANAPAELAELVEKSSNAVMTGFVPDIRPHLAKAEVFICPIRDGGGTKLKILDAFAAGKTVLAHPIALEGIDATADVNVATADTASDFVNRLCELFASPEKRSSLGSNARRLVVDKYSFASIGDGFASLLTSIAGEASK